MWNNLRRSLSSYGAHIATPAEARRPAHASWSGPERCLGADQLFRVSLLQWGPAQPSAALLLQLSLFLRHSSEAISLTRPAHFSSLSYPAQPPPFSLLHSITLLLFFAALFSFCRLALNPNLRDPSFAAPSSSFSLSPFLSPCL